MQNNNADSNFPKLNPYGYAYRMIRDRLKWDLNSKSWDSKRKLTELKDKYSGKKAVILCNGPSLNKVNFDLFNDDIFTFGLNKINLLFEKSDFRPSAIVAVNDFVIEQNKDFYNETDIPLFLDSRTNKHINSRRNVHFLHSTPVKIFVKNCSGSINQGGTVTFVAMQLAFHMGFSEVGLVGCDHYFKDKGFSNSVVTSTSADANHFDPRYFAAGQQWQLPDLNQSEYSYSLAKENFEAHNRKIYNCTEGGHLEIYDRKPLEEFLK
ncbi:MAG TPA: 6-hydroxymethylpterin diphosphokinase MptE-like protein [Mucilaginibacter sp.]|nr:6-hydroxymethylpterin diphosphokinase MptE-like protein [Mucilaginibacter sp.]